MFTAILMMAGNATRMHSKENKVYLPLGNQMVFEYSLNLFLKNHFEVICVIQKKDRAYLKDYESKVKIVYGGMTRQESAYNGLKEATGTYVLFHDAARPFITQNVIDSCVQALNLHKACLVVHPCKDSLYQKNPLVSMIRDNVVLAQTPQGGKRVDFLKAHQMALAEQASFTDDISLLMKYSDTLVELIEGNETNFKITTQLDYIIARELVKND